jgi:hypothetical protein
MKSRYCTNHAVRGRIGWHLTPWERIAQEIRRRRKRREEPDVFPIVGCFAPVFPRK